MMRFFSKLTPLRLALAVVALPVAASAAYSFLLAQDRFVSESTIAMRETGGGASSSGLPGAAFLLANLTTPAREDAQLLQTYVRSLALLQRLETQQGLRRHYASAKRDIIARLSDDASQEDFLDYFHKRVTVQVDEISSTLNIQVQGFDPQFAQQLNKALLAECERFVNEVSQNLARERLGFAESELSRAAGRLETSKQAFLEFQNRNKLLNAPAEAEAKVALIADLTTQVARTEAELRTMQSYLNKDAYPVRALEGQLSSLRKQLDVERGRAAGGGGTKTQARINALAADYQTLELQTGFALDAYKLALAAVESARIDASRKLKDVVVIDPPSLAETALLPKRLYNVTAMLVVTLMLYGALRLIVATINEHQD